MPECKKREEAVKNFRLSAERQNREDRTGYFGCPCPLPGLQLGRPLRRYCHAAGVAHRPPEYNDRAVMEAYGFPVKTMTEESCVAELMKMYRKLVEKEDRKA
jgi:hypothetical protein